MSLLNFHFHSQTIFSLPLSPSSSAQPCLSPFKPQTFFLKPSLCSSLRFSLYHQPQQWYSNDGAQVVEEEEENVIGDCVVFEEGIFLDPYLEEKLEPRSPSIKPQKNKPRIDIQQENLIPEKWLEAQMEINITKKERRKLAQEMEFGRRLEKRKQGLRPIVEEDQSVKKYVAAKLSQFKPLVLDNPEFPLKDSQESEGGVSDVVLSSRVAPKNPKLQVHGTTLDNISEFLNSGNYDPDASNNSEGSRKLFTREEKVLLNRRVPDLASATSGKWRPLHTAAASGEFYLVDALLKYNVDINSTDKDGLTAIHKAILGKKQAIFNYLLRESTDPFVRDKDGATLMHYAVRTASIPMIKVLLLYNVDLNLPDNDGWTPLHLAVQSRRTDVVRLLLMKGADKTLKNNDGLTPFDLCLHSGRDIRSYELIRLMQRLPKPRR